MDEFEPNTMASRIAQRLYKLKKTAAAASMEATGGRDAIRKIFDKAKKGENFNPRSDTVRGLASALETTIAWLTDGQGPEEVRDTRPGSDGIFMPATGAVNGVPEAGFVEAGAFRRTDPFRYPEDAKRAPIQPDPRYPQARQVAWQCIGDSMDEVGIRDGMWVLGAVYEDWKTYYGDVQSGKFVVVQRSTKGLSEHEITVKEIRFFQSRFELVPHSSNPIHQALVVEYNHDADTDEMRIELIAVVLGAYHAY